VPWQLGAQKRVICADTITKRYPERQQIVGDLREATTPGSEQIVTFGNQVAFP
jgi:hypothetical protein